MKKMTNKKLSSLEPQYVLDKTGKKVSVLIDINRFSTFMDEVEDLYLGMQAYQALSEGDQETISHSDIVKMVDSEQK